MCTIFKATNRGVTLVGNNEDHSDSYTKVWFLAPQSGKFGRVYFGYRNGWAQGGMNDHGLFFDWVSGYQEEWLPQPDKKKYGGNLCEKILEESSTVAEVISIYERYNEPSFSYAKVMYVDAAGDSAVIGFENGKLHIQYGERHQAVGYAFKTADLALAHLDSVSVPAFEDILKSCLQSGEYPTQYSNIYDLTSLDVYVYDFHERSKCFKFNLIKELQRGSHCFLLHHLDEQLEGSLTTDYKTEASQLSTFTSLTNLDLFAGVYQLKDRTLTIRKHEDNLWLFPNLSSDDLFLQLIPDSETEWYIPWLDAKLTFLSTESGRYDQFLFQGGFVEDSDESRGGLPFIKIQQLHV